MNVFKHLNFWDGLVLALFLFCLLGTVYTPFSPTAQSFREIALSGPSWNHWLGVDGMGRDFGSRLWAGSGNSILYGLGAVTFTFLLSCGLLGIHSVMPRWGRQFIPTLVGLWVAMPVIFIGLLLLVFLRPSAWTLMLAVGLGNVPFVWRQLRVYWKEHATAMHVTASRVLGNRGWDLFVTAIWPNLQIDVWSLLRLVFAFSLLELSGLAFLGLIGDPDFPELGSILKQNQAYLFQAPGFVLLPGIGISLILLLVHLSRGNTNA